MGKTFEKIVVMLFKISENLLHYNYIKPSNHATTKFCFVSSKLRYFNYLFFSITVKERAAILKNVIVSFWKVTVTLEGDCNLSQ